MSESDGHHESRMTTDVHSKLQSLIEIDTCF